MLNLKTFMTYLLTLCVALFIVACDGGSDCEEGAGDAAGAAAGSEEMAAGADEECEEGGAVGGETGAGDAAGETAGDDAGAEPVAAYTRVIVIDTTTDVNNDGVPGVDICEIEVSCDGGPVNGDNASFAYDPEASESPICDGSNGDNCLCKNQVNPTCTSGIDRTDGELAFNGDAACGDDYVSLGISGYIEYDNPALASCSSIDVTVTEKEGPNEESYNVALCTDAADNINISEMMFGDACETIGSGTDGGSTSFSWSAPAGE